MLRYQRFQQRVANMGATVSAHSDFISHFGAFDTEVAAAATRGQAFRQVRPRSVVVTQLLSPQDLGRLKGSLLRRWEISRGEQLLSGRAPRLPASGQPATRQISRLPFPTLSSRGWSGGAIVSSGCAGAHAGSWCAIESARTKKQYLSKGEKLNKRSLFNQIND